MLLCFSGKLITHFGGHNEWHVQLELLDFPTHFLWSLGSIPVASETELLNSWHPELSNLNIYCSLGFCVVQTSHLLVLFQESFQLWEDLNDLWPKLKNRLTSILPKKKRSIIWSAVLSLTNTQMKEQDIFFSWILLKNWEMINEQMACDLLY